jgi:hypothetical protein
VYLGDWEEKQHEAVAYAIFHPLITTEDFFPMALSLWLGPGV